MTETESSEQFNLYAEMAIEMACNDIDKLIDRDFINRLHELPSEARNRVLKHIASNAISSAPEEKRLALWVELSRFIRVHKDMSSASWALSKKEISRIERVVDRLSPKNPFAIHRMLFSDYDFPLYKAWKDWDDLDKQRQTRRQQAITEILEYGDVEAVIRLAKGVENPKLVGNALAECANVDIDSQILPKLLVTDDEILTQFSQGYVWGRRHKDGWEWADELDRSSWTDTQTGLLLCWLPFTEEAWRRAEAWLGKREGEYWRRTSARLFYNEDGDIGIAIDKLIEHQRPKAAIQCLSLMRHDRGTFDKQQALRALLTPLDPNEPEGQELRYAIIEIIQDLQADPEANQEDLIKVEWAYLPLLERHLGASPKTLEFRLASVPGFFCQVIQLIFRPEGQEARARDLNDHQKTLAQSAYSLLFEWKTPPGTQQDGTFSPDAFSEWLDYVKAVCGESGHIEIALEQVGEVLIHCPPDADGLWIHRSVAQALNDRDVEAMRDGFSIGTRNSRGMYRVDGTGNQERELAEENRQKADAIENAGYHRLAVTMRELAEYYDHEAERNISRGEHWE